MSESPTKAQVVFNDQAHRFEVQEGNTVAVLEYQIRGADRIALTHTEVPKELEGKGVGGALVKAALDYARAHKLKVLPQCPFVRVYLQRHPEFHDLIAPYSD